MIHASNYDGGIITKRNRIQVKGRGIVNLVLSVPLWALISQIVTFSKKMNAKTDKDRGTLGECATLQMLG